MDNSSIRWTLHGVLVYLLLNTALSNEMTCDFSSSLCGWLSGTVTTLKPHGATWERTEGIPSNLEFGFNDVAAGYLAINNLVTAEYEPQDTRQAVLYSPVVEVSGPQGKTKCFELTFYYVISLEYTPWIKVYRIYPGGTSEQQEEAVKEVWALTGATRTWVQGTVTFEEDRDFQVAIVASRGPYSESIIAMGLFTFNECGVNGSALTVETTTAGSTLTNGGKISIEIIAGVTSLLVVLMIIIIILAVFNRRATQRERILNANKNRDGGKAELNSNTPGLSVEKSGSVLRNKYGNVTMDNAPSEISEKRSLASSTVSKKKMHVNKESPPPSYTSQASSKSQKHLKVPSPPKTDSKLRS